MTANPKRHVAKRLTMNKRLSTQRIKSPKQPPKTTTINKRLSYQTAQEDLAKKRHTALLQLALQTQLNLTDSHQTKKWPPKTSDSE